MGEASGWGMAGSGWWSQEMVKEMAGVMTANVAGVVPGMVRRIMAGHRSSSEGDRWSLGRGSVTGVVVGGGYRVAHSGHDFFGDRVDGETEQASKVLISVMVEVVERQTKMATVMIRSGGKGSGNVNMEVRRMMTRLMTDGSRRGDTVDALGRIQ